MATLKTKSPYIILHAATRCSSCNVGHFLLLSLQFDDCQQLGMRVVTGQLVERTLADNIDKRMSSFVSQMESSAAVVVALQRIRQDMASELESEACHCEGLPAARLAKLCCSSLWQIVEIAQKHS